MVAERDGAEECLAFRHCFVEEQIDSVRFGTTLYSSVIGTARGRAVDADVFGAFENVRVIVMDVRSRRFHSAESQGASGEEGRVVSFVVEAVENRDWCHDVIIAAAMCAILNGLFV